MQLQSIASMVAAINSTHLVLRLRLFGRWDVIVIELGPK